MKIFLSHRSRDKAFVREFKGYLPDFLDTWLDEESLSWGDSLPATLKSIIQSGVDFLIIFLDKDALQSAWVKQELEWAIAREQELKRTFVLPIMLENVSAENLPSGFPERLQLRLQDFSKPAVQALAERATLALFKLVVESFSALRQEVPNTKSLRAVQDELSGGQARLLGCVAERCKTKGEVAQREIEIAMGHAHTSGELFYRLESLLAQGFLMRRRMTDGQFIYRLSDAFAAEIAKS